MTIHPDHSVKVEQAYIESPLNPDHKRDSLGVFNTKIERTKYNSAVISDFKDFHGASFSFEISNIDSLPKYVSGLPEDLIEMNMLGDSIFLFQTNELESRPTNYGPLAHAFVIDFPRAIKTVSESKKSWVFWKPKRDSNRITITVNSKKFWRKKRKVLIAVELKKIDQ